MVNRFVAGIVLGCALVGIAHKAYAFGGAVAGATKLPPARPPDRPKSGCIRLDDGTEICHAKHALRGKQGDLKRAAVAKLPTANTEGCFDMPNGEQVCEEARQPLPPPRPFLRK